MKKVSACFFAVVALAGFAFLPGCPQPDPEGQTSAITLFTVGESTKQGGGPVDLAEIQSLELTITEISLDYAGNASEGEADEEFEGSKITVFSGALEVDLLNLIDVSEIISEAEIPAGTYTKIRISIANPRLVLVSDPETVITDVHLTANNRLFVSETFELPEGQSSLIVLDLGGIALRQQGQGGG